MMKHKIKTLQETKDIFEKLKTDPKCILFSMDKINIKLLKKLKKLPQIKDKQSLKLIDLLENNVEEINDSKVPTRVDYEEKREFDRSTLYDFDGSFQLLHADVANLEFLAKSAGVPITLS